MKNLRKTATIFLILTTTVLFSQNIKLWHYELGVYKRGYWSGNVVDGYAEGYGTGRAGDMEYKGYVKKGKPHGLGTWTRLNFKRDITDGNNKFLYTQSVKRLGISGVFNMSILEGESLLEFDPPFQGASYISYRCYNGVPKGKAIAYKSNGKVLTRGYCTNGSCEFTETIFDVIAASDMFEMGLFIATIYSLSNNSGASSSNYGNFAYKLFNCGTQYYVGRSFEDPIVQGLISEAVASTLEKRKYSSRAASVNIALNDLKSKLSARGYSNLAESINLAELIKCLSESN